MGDLSSEFREAIRRVKERGTQVPWKDHPDDLLMSLYVARELTDQVRKQFEAHLAACSSCTVQAGEIRSALDQVTSHAEALAIAQGALTAAEDLVPVRELVSASLMAENVDELVIAATELGTSETITLEEDAYALVSTEAKPCPVFLSTRDEEFRVSAGPRVDPPHCALLPAGLKGEILVQSRDPHWSLVPIDKAPRLGIVSRKVFGTAIDKERLTRGLQSSLLIDAVEVAHKDPTAPALDVIENHNVMRASWWKTDPYFKAFAQIYSIIKTILPSSTLRRLVLVHDRPDCYTFDDLEAMAERLKNPDGNVYWARLEHASSLATLDCAIIAAKRVFSIDRAPGENTFRPRDLGTESDPDRAAKLQRKIDEIIDQKAMPVALRGKLTPDAEKIFKAQGVEGLLRKVSAGELPRRTPTFEAQVRMEEARAAVSSVIGTVAALPEDGMALALQEGIRMAASDSQLTTIKTVISQIPTKKEAQGRKKPRS